MLIYWIWLATRPGMSEWEKLAVLERFSNPEDIYFATEQSFSSVEGLTKAALAALCDKNLDEAQKIAAVCTRKKIRILTWHDAMYPRRLKNIADPPLILYYKGVLPDLDANPVIGVVGTRQASAYGLNIAGKLSSEIAACGGLVISGMAKGVDAWATRGALEAQTTAVGVLGCGVDRVYPACNAELFRKMERSGCLLSEYPPGTKPDKWNFPRRNRIISGISCGVLVVEAPVKSGALITARQAMEQGRDVFVVPGNIDVATCAGSNALLRDGAIAVTSGWDVLSEYESLFPEKIHKAQPKEKGTSQAGDKKVVDKTAPPPYSDLEINTADLTQDETVVLQHISGEQMIDTLIAETGLETAAVLAAVTLLEIKGYVATLPGRRVIRK